MSVKQKSKFKWPDKLDIISWKGIVEGSRMNKGEDIYHDWGDILQNDTGMKVHIGGEYDAVDRYRWLGHLKLFDLTRGGPDETNRMLIADQRHCVRDGGPFPIRIAWVCSRGNVGFFTRGDSKIRTPHDIKPGTRICRITYVDTSIMMDGLLSWAQVRNDDVIWINVNNPTENCLAVVEGRADLGLSWPTLPTTAEAERNPYGINWIDLNSKDDPAGAKRFRDIDPMVIFGVMNIGVTSAIGHWGMIVINFEVTRADTSAELIYNLARWLDENYERFKDKHPVNKFRNRETFIEGIRHTFLPCHEGTIAYLKDIGLWTKAHEVRQAENKELVDRYAAAYKQCMWEADEKRIWVARENEEWVKFWNNYRKANLPEFKLFDDLPEIINKRWKG